jgi:hypothetical protein
MGLAREWTAFAGAVFALMGVALAAAARRHAGDALAWDRQWRDAAGAPRDPRDDKNRLAGLERGYRIGGLAFASAGAALLLAAASGIAFDVASADRAALPGGIFFTACGLFMAYNGLQRRRSRSPRFLLGDPLAAEAKLDGGERVALFCARALIALFVAFGIRLLREGLS